MRKPNVREYFNRLTRIKTIIDTEFVTNLSDVKYTVKGSAFAYTWLSESDIVYREDGRLHWKESIPVTKRLAKTLCHYITERNTEYRKRKAENERNSMLNNLVGDEQVKPEAIEENIDQVVDDAFEYGPDQDENIDQVVEDQQKEVDHIMDHLDEIKKFRESRKPLPLTTIYNCDASIIDADEFYKGIEVMKRRKKPIEEEIPMGMKPEVKKPKQVEFSMFWGLIKFKKVR